MIAFNHISGKYFDFDDAKIYYEITGNKEGPVILFLHGGFGTMEDFNSVLPALNDNYCVIGVDSIGHGKSTIGSRKLSYELIQKGVESLLQSLNIKKLSIIGFSDGGIIASRLAAYSPLEIEKLVVIDSRWHINDALRTKDIFLRITAESWATRFPDTYETYEKLNTEADFDKLAPAVVAMWLDDSKSGYPNEDIKNFTNPLLIVRGDADHLTSRESNAELASLVKNSMLLNIPFAGHAAYLDQPEIFKIVLKQFLN